MICKTWPVLIKIYLQICQATPTPRRVGSSSWASWSSAASNGTGHVRAKLPGTIWSSKPCMARSPTWTSSLCTLRAALDSAASILWLARITLHVASTCATLPQPPSPVGWGQATLSSSCACVQSTFGEGSVTTETSGTGRLWLLSGIAMRWPCDTGTDVCRVRTHKRPVSYCTTAAAQAQYCWH